MGRLFRTLTGWFLLSASVHAATRVALVSTCGGDEGADVLALAEAQLSAAAEIVLVERRDVERVLAEQNLMRCGLSEVDQAVAVGKLLGVEMYAALETIPKEKAVLGLVVFDAGTGVKLQDAVLPAGGPEKMAGAVVSAVRTACEKRQRGPAGLILICVLAVRNAELPRELDSFCESFGLLLERRMLDSPSLAVLERRHLEQVNRERSLPASAPAGDLFPSLVVMELEMSRAQATNGIQATALLSDGSGKRIGKVAATVDNRDLAELSRALLGEVTGALKVAPAGRRDDRAREAERFLIEANFLRDQGEPARALQWNEAAAALDPTNLTIESQLAAALGRRATEALHEGKASLSEVLDRAARALDLCVDVRQRTLARDGRVEPSGPEELLWHERFWIAAINRLGREDTDVKVRLLELQRQLRTLELETVLPHSRDPRNDLRAYWDYTGLVGFLLWRMEALSPSADAWIAGTEQAVSHWLKLVDDHRLARTWSLGGIELMARLCLQARGPFPVVVPHINNWQVQKPQLERLRGIFRQMERHRDPVVRIYGMMGQLASDLHGKESLSDDSRRRYEEIKGTIRQEIRKPSREPERTTRSNAYGTALDLIDVVFDDAAARRREYLDLFEFMIAQKHCAYWPIKMVSDPDAHTFQHFRGQEREVIPCKPAGWTQDDYPTMARNLERALTLERSPECLDADCGFWSYRTGSPQQDFAEVQRKLLAARPDLAPKPSPPPWSEARPLFDVRKDGGFKSIAAPCLDGDVLYVITVATNEHVGYARIPLDGSLARLSQSVRSSSVRCATLQDRKLYVGTAADGVLVFSTDGGSVERISRADGLPSENVEALACTEGKLFAGLDGGYLVSFDLKTRRCDVLASSRRRDKKSPLDDLTPPVRVNAMLADPPRHRVLFLADFGTAECMPLLGVWQMDTRTSRVSQIVQFDRCPFWMQRHDRDRVLIHFWRFRNMIYMPERGACTAPAVGLVSFDLNTDTGQLVFAWTIKGVPVNAAGPKLPGGEKVITMPMNSCPPFLLVNGWLWFRDGRHQSGRISADGKKIDYFPSLAEGKPPQWETLQAIGNGAQVLATDAHCVWLLTLREK